MTKIQWVLACCVIWELCNLMFVGANASVSLSTSNVEESFALLPFLNTTSTVNTKNGNANANANANDTDQLFSNKDGVQQLQQKKQQQLIDWNVQTLLFYLGNLHAQQRNETSPSSSLSYHDALPASVVEQARAYVATIASLYRPQNHFHNFEHATQVTRAMHHLITGLLQNDHSSTHLQPHMQSIRQDPLLHVVLMLAALVHDVEHTGVPNTQRILEEPHLILNNNNNNNQSIAERHSLHVAWHLLQRPEFDQFRGLLLLQEELLQSQAFYHWMETAIMATDIADADLRTDRQTRWDVTFGERATISSSNNDDKIIIAMEHMMQIADVAHTMNIDDNEDDDNVHNDDKATTKNVFRKWNQRLFAELQQAYRDGRSDKDPKQGWFQGEIGFFDFYIIPLAQRWEMCCSSGNEDNASLVTRARHNREEWIRNGQQFVDSP